IAVGITNTGMTFPIAFSYIRSESKAAFNFIFNCMKSTIWREDGAPPATIIGDQAAGLIASVPNALPGTILQFCEWHAVQNIRKRLAQAGFIYLFIYLFIILRGARRAMA